MAPDIESDTIRKRAANVMQCRLPWSTALANAEDLDRAGLLADRGELDRLRELAEWLAAQRPVVGVRPSVIAGPDARLNDAIARAREALGRKEG